MRQKALILSLMALLLGCGRGGEVPQKEVEGTRRGVPVEVIRVKRQRLLREVEAVGNVLPRQAVIITPKVPGKIEAIYVEEGDRVEKGQVIIKLDQTDFLLAVKRAEAALDSARAALRQAEVNFQRAAKDYERFSALRQREVISQREFEQVEAAYRGARAQLNLARAKLKEAEAVLERARAELQDTLIAAPFSGIVTKRFVDPGQRAYTMPPTDIVEIMDIETVKVAIGLPERDLPSVSIGTPVEVVLDAYPGQTFRGTISAIIPKVDPRSRTFKVEVTLPNPERVLKPGMFCRVKVKTGEVEALVVPRETIMRMPATGVEYCFVVEANRAYRRNIKTGLKKGNLVEVLEGLKEGELVVISGQHGLKSGMEVEVRDAGT